MSPKPTRETVEEMLTDFEAHGLIGSRRDVYEFVVSVLKDWLAQEEELGSLVDTLLERDREILAIQVENQALKTENQKAICEALTEQRRKMGAEIDELLEQKMAIQMAAKEEIDKLQAETQALKAHIKNLQSQLEVVISVAKKDGHRIHCDMTPKGNIFIDWTFERTQP